MTPPSLVHLTRRLQACPGVVLGAPDLRAVVADLLRDVRIDKDVRGRDKPSDHVPVWVELDA